MVLLKPTYYTLSLENDFRKWTGLSIQILKSEQIRKQII